ncbi:hypothetical protein EPIR_3734 [Erwinia piriflorinigrans CFBP 5888]|uniref:Uncharacterized protein n=1 Tax=Erwinia piriflorinigrans CFBP 5888 TaxID=1161919 RepID=V5ZD97_9GAMM|nr:hypothetical protein EPIR_3734 [Erwinia piriflorinigrans CFBP 5888]
MLCSPDPLSWQNGIDNVNFSVGKFFLLSHRFIVKGVGRLFILILLK